MTSTETETETLPEFEKALIAALFGAFQPIGIVSAWPDCGWPDDDDDDGTLDDEEWIVGVAYRTAFDDSSAYKVEPFFEPSAYTELAIVRGGTKARALADFLNGARETV